MARKVTVLVVLLCLFSASHLTADQLVLKNKGLIEGTIVEENDKKVVIDMVGTGKIEFSRAEILEIKKGPVTPLVPKEKTPVAESAAATAPSASPHKETSLQRSEAANRMGNQGLALIDSGNFEGGMALLREAIHRDPQSPSWHMNYASMAIAKASTMADGARKDALIKVIEPELLEAVRLFDDRKDKLLIAHCYFLIGDTYFYGFKNVETAKKYYRKSLDYNPAEQRAIDGMIRAAQASR